MLNNPIQVPMTVSSDAETVQLSVALDPKGDVVLVINDGTQFDVSVVGQTLVFTRSNNYGECE